MFWSRGQAMIQARSVVVGICTVLISSGVLHANNYDTLLKRYQKQIKQQEKRLESLKASLANKERDAQRWQKKSDEAKVSWNQAGVNAERARTAVEGTRAKLQKTRTLATAAEWSATEHTLQAYTADSQLAQTTRELYVRRLTPRSSAPITLQERFSEFIITPLANFSQKSHQEAQTATAQETALRTEEIRWQNEEQQRVADLDRLHDRQQALYQRWQEALRRRAALEEEKAQVEQSEKALQVMLQELREHRDHTLAARQGQPVRRGPIAALRGTLPWPARGRVTQNFGRQYSSELNQLLISNGIKIEASSGLNVRAIQPGKVLFASLFRQYGQLVIVQHRSGLTSVYGGLGQVQVKEGDMVSALDAIGAVGTAGSFYFELRRDEEPVDPLVYLVPSHPSDLSSRRKFQ